MAYAVRHRDVVALSGVCAVRRARPAEPAFSANVPLLTGILPIPSSSVLPAVLFPVVLRETHLWARDRHLRYVPELATTVTLANITTSPAKPSAVCTSGRTALTRRASAVKRPTDPVMPRLVVPTPRARDTAHRCAS